MKKFEYLSVESAKFVDSDRLNNLGAGGWELVSHNTVTHEEDNTLYYEHYYIFKRELL